MTVGQMIYLGLGGLLFAAWAFQMFSVLFELRRRAARQTGKMFPGVGDSLRGWRDWLTSDADRAARRRLGLTTLVLFAWIGINAARGIAA
ncbi:hypothetical protein ACOXXX_14120 [Thalassococcus sp. BH17M4-6]|uniref:hypothetical protein n=1 Tax=Thalassococcus sp. BH17M4-6 TaxID=3413148 RepID=UPI003BDD21AF